MLTPDTAHGTNATVTMGSFEVVKVGTDDRGGVDVEDLGAKAGDDVACLMLTNAARAVRPADRGDRARRP